MKVRSMLRLRHHLLTVALGIATLGDATILSTAQSRSSITEPPVRFDVVEATVDDVAGWFQHRRRS